MTGRPVQMPFFVPPAGRQGYTGGPQFPTPGRQQSLLTSATLGLLGRDQPRQAAAFSRRGPTIFLPELPSVLPLGTRPFPPGAIIRVPGMPPMVAGEPIPLEPGETVPAIIPPRPFPTPGASKGPQRLIIVPPSQGSSAPAVLPIPMPMPMPMPSAAPACNSPHGPIIISPHQPSSSSAPPAFYLPPPPPPAQNTTSADETMAIMMLMMQFNAMDDYDYSGDEEDQEREERRREKKQRKKERKKERAKERAQRQKAREEAERQMKQPQKQMPEMSRKSRSKSDGTTTVAIGQLKQSDDKTTH